MKNKKGVQGYADIVPGVILFVGLIVFFILFTTAKSSLGIETHSSEAGFGVDWETQYIAIALAELPFSELEVVGGGGLFAGGGATESFDDPEIKVQQHSSLADRVTRTQVDPENVEMLLDNVLSQTSFSEAEGVVVWIFQNDTLLATGKSKVVRDVSTAVTDILLSDAIREGKIAETIDQLRKRDGSVGYVMIPGTHNMHIIVSKRRKSFGLAITR